jgi:hypothetical protein
LAHEAETGRGGRRRREGVADGWSASGERERSQEKFSNPIHKRKSTRDERRKVKSHSELPREKNRSV